MEGLERIEIIEDEHWDEIERTEVTVFTAISFGSQDMVFERLYKDYEMKHNGQQPANINHAKVGRFKDEDIYINGYEIHYEPSKHIELTPVTNKMIDR